ncbi:hypothetical protein [Candidatus Tisiphia endosymbiont of Hybos culiciformis]|uniref:hypothetical protein n=1 Tax=Candidatus Tisiphia endosymbiont of Hybos culiciformis TaxID=3139331 RepID=UPI003CCABA51
MHLYRYIQEKSNDYFPTANLISITPSLRGDLRSTKQSISGHFLDCFVATKVAPR